MGFEWSCLPAPLWALGTLNAETLGDSGALLFPKAWATPVGLRSRRFGRAWIARAGGTAFGKMGVRSEPSRKQRMGL